MRRGAKFLTIVAATLAVLILGSGLLLAGTIAATGLVTVRVNEQGPEGTNLYVPVPAGLLYLGLAALPHVLPDEELAEIRTELGELGPAIAALGEALEDCPDAVLVDVQERGESVRITKQGRSLLIHVDDGRDEVRISVPAALFSRTVNALI
jgi:hypothetical protein